MTRAARLVSSKKRRFAFGGAVLVAIVAAVTAIAFFTSTGIGTGSASAGTLGAPTLTATGGAGTAALSWTAVNPPTGSDPVTYYVTRDGGNAGGNCATSASPTTATSCTDSALSAGTYHYTVTAKWHSWTATSNSQTATVGSSDTTPPTVTVTSVNGSVRTFPYSTAANVTSIGGNCGTAAGDIATVSWSVGPRSGTAACSSGTWTSGSFTAITSDGSYSAQVSQSDTAGNTGSDSKTVVIDKTAPTNALSLTNQSAQAGPASTTNAASFLSGSTVWYANGTSGNFSLRNALTDALSGPASSTFGSLGGTTSGWTFTGSTVATPSGGPYVSNAFSWAANTTSAASEAVTGTDAAGNTNSPTNLTFRYDNAAPNESISFPATNGKYTNATWNAAAGSCSAGTICGTASDPGQASVATPAFGSASSAAVGGTSSLALNAPAGIANGDVLIAAVTENGGTANSITAPSGWTLIRRTDNGSNVSIATYYHAVTNAGTEPASYSWTFPNNTRVAGGIMRYTGVDPVNPIDASNGGIGTGTSMTAPGVTTSAANDMVVGVFGIDATGATVTAPSGMTERFDVLASNGNNGPATEGADVSQAAAGATGSKTASSSASGDWAAQLVALNPAPPTMSGLAKVQLSIQGVTGANAGKYWDPSANVGLGGFTSLTETLVNATGTTSWSLPFAASNFAEGTYVVRAYAIDNVGNFTTASTTNVLIDNTAPTTTDNTASIGNAWKNTSQTVTLTPSDGTGSGVAATYYTTDGSTPTTASSQGTTITLTNTGVYTIKYFSVDALGNTETVKTAGTQIRIDKALPTNALSLGTANGAYLSGSTLFYKSNAAGSFTLVNTVTDVDSGPASTTFPAIATVGWTHNAETVTGASPFTSSTYSWTASPTNPVAQNITSADVAGNTSAATAVSFTSDITAPGGGALTVNGTAASGAGTSSYNTSGSFTIGARTDYTDAGSGLASSVLTIQSATLIGNVCGTYGAPSTITGTPAQSQPTGCYLYTLKGTDNVGNTASVSTTVMVDATPPSTPTLAFSGLSANAFYSAGLNTLYFRPATGGTFTVTASSSDADTLVKSGNAGYTFSSLGANNFTAGTQSGGVQSYTFTTTATQPGADPTVLATNNAGANSSSASYHLSSDTTAPTSGALSVNGTAASGAGSTSFFKTVSGSWLIDSRLDYSEPQSVSASGLASSTLVVQYATLSANACGTFGSSTVIVGSPAQSATSGDGCYRYTLTGTDNVGNATSISTIVKVDTVTPATTIALSPVTPNGSNGWYKTTAPTFTLAATDGGSGVATISYQIDGGTTTTYTAAVSVPNGQHTITYWATDNAGNVESTHTTTVKVDTVAPANVLSLVNQGALNGQATSFLSGTTLYYNGNASSGRTFQIQNALSDASSGPASTLFAALAGTSSGFTFTSSTVSTPSGGPYVSNTVTWTAPTTSAPTETVTGTDTAGNANAGTTLTFANDSAAPASGALTVNGTAATSGGSSSTASGAFTIGTRTDYSETQTATASGLASSTLTVQSATLTGSTCGAAGSGGPFTSPTTISGTTQPSGIVAGFCYVYTLTGTDNVGNTTSIKTTVAANDGFLVSNPGTQTEGNAFSVTLTASFGGVTDTSYSGTKTIAFSGPGNAPDGTAPSYPANVTFTNGVGSASITLFKAETTTLTATQGAITGSSTSFAVNPGAAARLAWASSTGTPGPVSNSAGTLTGGLCLFTCSYTGIGGSGSTFKAKLAVTDAKGNVVSGLGSSLSITVAKVGGSFTGSATVTIPASGQAISSSGGDGSVAGELTFATDSGGSWGPNSLTAAAGSFTGSNAATASFSK